MSEERKTIYLCLAHMSEAGLEQKYIKEAFDTNWVVPMGPNVNAFEKDLADFVNSKHRCSNDCDPNAATGTPAEPNENSCGNGCEPSSATGTLAASNANSDGGSCEPNAATGTPAEPNANSCGNGCEPSSAIGTLAASNANSCGGGCEPNAATGTPAEPNANSCGNGCTSNSAAAGSIAGSGKGFDKGSGEGYCGSGCDSLDRKVVCLSAGTAAVHLALIGCGVGPGDEVCVQSFTFCASSHPITYLGAKPVFIGSESETWNMDPDLLEKAILERKAVTGRYPKAIIPVALYGMPYRIDRIMEIAYRYDIPVIEDAAEGMGSRFDGQVLGTFGKYGVLSFNGNKMITTSGGGALICRSSEDANEVMWYATQARDAYPYYQHTAIGYNYRMSNVCAGIGRGQMTVLDSHIAHHRHVQALYEELLADVPGITIHRQPADRRFESNFWLCAATLDPNVKIAGQENAYKEVIKSAVGGAAGVIHSVDTAVTDCQPNANVEALRVFMLAKKVECRPLWKPMHKQPIYSNGAEVREVAGVQMVQEGPNMVVYTNGVEEDLFKVGFCLPAGPYVTDDDVRYIVNCLKEAIIR